MKIVGPRRAKTTFPFKIVEFNEMHAPLSGCVNSMVYALSTSIDESFRDGPNWAATKLYAPFIEEGVRTVRVFTKCMAMDRKNRIYLR